MKADDIVQVMAELEKLGPALPTTVRLIINPYMSSTEQPMLLCSREYFDALVKLIPKAAE